MTHWIAGQGRRSAPTAEGDHCVAPLRTDGENCSLNSCLRWSRQATNLLRLSGFPCNCSSKSVAAIPANSTDRSCGGVLGNKTASELSMRAWFCQCGRGSLGEVAPKAPLPERLQPTEGQLHVLCPWIDSVLKERSMHIHNTGRMPTPNACDGACANAHASGNDPQIPRHRCCIGWPR
jgi:hypothetical protein